MKWLINRYRTGMKSHNRILILLDITYKISFIMFLLPVFNFVLKYVMRLWGQSYVTVGNIRSFLTYPPFLFFLLIALFILSFYTLLKLSTLIHYTFKDLADTNSSMPTLIISGIITARRLLHKDMILLPLYSLLLNLFINLPTLIGFTVYLRLPADNWGGASDLIFVRGLMILALLFLGFISFPVIFALHSCIHDNKGLRYGIHQSKKLLKGRSIRTVLVLSLYNLGLYLLLYIVYYAALAASALIIYLFSEKQMVISVFLAIYPQINFYFIVLSGMTAFVTNLNIISKLYLTYLKLDNQLNCKNHPSDRYQMNWQANSHVNQTLSVPIYKEIASQSTFRYRPIVVSIFILFTAFGLLNFYQTIRNASFYLRDAITGVSIASHRGDSLSAPENTLPALEHAIEAHLDIAEIDIQQAKDGSLVLMHDRSLKRTTGLDMEVSSLSLYELKQLDAGAWFGKEFLHTPIPTLEEALMFCKNRIRLILDIKVYKKNVGLEEALVSLIEQYDYEHQCLVSSTDYRVLERIKNLNPRIKTGLIFTAAFGDYFDSEFIDYYSIRSPFITKSVVDSAHRLGKEIHAWTVNKISELERIKSLGVDCIITDNTLLTREILYRDDTTETFISLLNRMLKHRSFYQLVRIAE